MEFESGYPDEAILNEFINCANIGIEDLDRYLEYREIAELNQSFHNNNIHVYVIQVGGFGGLGGFGLTPETIDIIHLIIGDIGLNLLANFTYDALKKAIKSVMEKVKRKNLESDKMGFKVSHKGSAVIILMQDNNIDDELLDLSLRSLLQDVILSELPLDRTDERDNDGGLG